MPNEKNNTAERELRFSRLLDAPIKTVWKVWTDPRHVKLWWGPDGFSNTIHKMEVRSGGEWHLTMYGPDGKSYEIRSVFREIVKYKRIVYEQRGNFNCIATIEFESRNDKTFLEWTMLFESREYLIHSAKTFSVDTGLKQNAERLVSYLLRSVNNLI